MKILIIAPNSEIAKQTESCLLSFDPYITTYATALNQIPPAYPQQMWDYVVQIESDELEDSPTFTGKVRGFIHLPYQSDIEQMNQSLYKVYRDVILAGDGSTCACGANAYCKCH